MGADARAITFGVEPAVHTLRKGGPPIPGYDSPALPIKPSRDPAFSLIALSGAEPQEPVMVEVPLVMNNSAFSPSQEMVGWRIGFAHWHEHSTSFLQALNALRLAGAFMVLVDARWDAIDECVIEHRLDALICQESSPAFQKAHSNGNPSACEVLEDGTRIWFYGARWAGDRLSCLTLALRPVLRQTLRLTTRLNT
ncbi:hypothetical protein [Pseudomonas sp. 18175]|uniref:hypothetical protein n=1 Tax=Pseudomonas sp. 18175 TaxID=3390056 RepID=UPI003D1BD481